MADTRTADLFADPPELPHCGNCVVWNGLPSDAMGGCSVHGMRKANDVACGRWFGLTQLRSPLYGRAA